MQGIEQEHLLSVDPGPAGLPTDVGEVRLVPVVDPGDDVLVSVV